MATWVNFGILRNVTIADEDNSVRIESNEGVTDIKDMDDRGNIRMFGINTDAGEENTVLYDKAVAMISKEVEVETGNSSLDYSDTEATHWFNDIRLV